MRNRSAIEAATACADAAISSSRRSKTAWTTGSPSRSFVMSMCWRSMSPTTVSANGGRAVMHDFLPANSGKSRRSVARFDRVRQRVEHGEQPALELEPEDRRRELPLQGGGIHPDLELDERVVTRRRELEARVCAGH